MALWTGAFMKQTSQANELTRQRIIQEERCGRMPSQEHIPKPEYMDMVRGVPGARTVRDPWTPSGRVSCCSDSTVGDRLLFCLVASLTPALNFCSAPFVGSHGRASSRQSWATVVQFRRCEASTLA